DLRRTPPGRRRLTSIGAPAQARPDALRESTLEGACRRARGPIRAVRTVPSGRERTAPLPGACGAGRRIVEPTISGVRLSLSSRPNQAVSEGSRAMDHSFHPIALRRFATGGASPFRRWDAEHDPENRTTGRAT